MYSVQHVQYINFSLCVCMYFLFTAASSSSIYIQVIHEVTSDTDQHNSRFHLSEVG